MDECVESFNLKGVKDLCKKLEEAGKKKEQIRSCVERSLTTRALLIGPSFPIDVVDDFLQFVILLAKEGLCAVSFTIQVLQDMFDVSVIKRCEELFAMVEKSIAVFKTEFFFNTCKNLILRMCNDLLKRLSRTVNTAFCGRIIVLLAKSLPLNERSGLNLPGHYNTENVTVFDTDENKMDSDQSMEERADEDEDRDEGELREKDLNVTINYALYVKFWEIQTYFSNPNLLNDVEAFKKFESNLNDVLTVFFTFKLERSGSSKSNDDAFTPVLANGFVDKCNGKCAPSTAGAMDANSTHDESAISLKGLELEDDFFAKYLTSQKLFNLQLADSQFRRYFLVQCLILMNCLGAKSRNKDSVAIIQDSFLNEVTEKCYAALKETYPHGSHFAESVRRIIIRERSWIAWKSEGCANIVEPRLDYKCLAYKKRPVDRFNPNSIDLSNVELTRLWNINPNNLAACMDEQRNCVPELKKFVEDGLDEMDPEQQVEEQYRSVNNENYQWMASRFLLYNSDNYLNCATLEVKAPSKPTSKFLEQSIHLSAMNIPELKERAEAIEKKLEEIEMKKQAEILRQAEVEKERLKREAVELAARREAEQKAATEKGKAAAAEKERETVVAAEKARKAEEELRQKQRNEKRVEAERAKKEEAERMRKEELEMKARLEQKVENAQKRKATIKKESDETEAHVEKTRKEDEKLRNTKDDDKTRAPKEDDKLAKKASSNTRRNTAETALPKNGHHRESEPVSPTSNSGDGKDGLSSVKKRKTEKLSDKNDSISSRHIKMETSSSPQHKTARRGSNKRN